MAVLDYKVGDLVRIRESVLPWEQMGMVIAIDDEPYTVHVRWMGPRIKGVNAMQLMRGNDFALLEIVSKA